MDSLHALLLAEHDKVLQQIDVLEKESKRLRRERFTLSNTRENHGLRDMIQKENNLPSQKQHQRDQGIGPEDA